MPIDYRNKSFAVAPTYTRKLNHPLHCHDSKIPRRRVGAFDLWAVEFVRWFRSSAYGGVWRTFVIILLNVFSPSLFTFNAGEIENKAQEFSSL